MPRFLPKAVVLLGSAWLVLGCELRPAQVPETSVEAAPVDRQATLDGARDYAIELLERRDYASLVINVIDSSTLEHMASTTPGDNVIEGAIADFASSAEPHTLLAKLRDSTRRVPALTASGAVARFEVDVPNEHETLAFERVNGRWYLK